MTGLTPSARRSTFRPSPFHLLAVAAPASVGDHRHAGPDAPVRLPSERLPPRLVDGPSLYRAPGLSAFVRLPSALSRALSSLTQSRGPGRNISARATT